MTESGVSLQDGISLGDRLYASQGYLEEYLAFIGYLTDESTKAWTMGL